MTVAAGHQIVTFRLGDDLFAADINDVERVLRYAVPTPVPNVPAWVQGVIEYRSRVVPVIDLRSRFELPEAGVTGATRLMVLSSEGEWIAAVVDAVLEVVSIGASPLAPPPPLFDGMAADFLKGILRRNDRLIIVLDVTRLLATKDRLAFDRDALARVPAPEPAAAPGPAAEAPPAHASSPEALTALPGAGESRAAEARDDALGDLMIIRGSPDPAAGEGFALGETSSDADPGLGSAGRSGPAVPPTPDWGTSATPRPRPGIIDGDGSDSSNG